MTQKKKVVKKIEKTIKKLIKKIVIERFSIKFFKKNLYLTNLDNKKDLANIIYLVKKIYIEKIKRSNKLIKLTTRREITVN